MMSKYVNREQGLDYGRRLLHKSVMKIWAVERNVPAIARSFSGHHQMVLDILDNKSDHNYLRERGGISFGIRNFVYDNTRRGWCDHRSETTKGG